MPRRTSTKKPRSTKGKEFTSLPFVVYVMAKCKKFNVNFCISPDKEVIRGGVPCDGFFEAPEKGESGILIVCIDKDLNEVLHTLAHEFSHLMQWYEDDPLYLNWEKSGGDDNNLKLEQDAEKRALQFLADWDILDPDAKERSAKYIEDFKNSK
jgi:hypothetical protein